MKVVLDTSAIIYLNDFRLFEEMVTVEEVIKEVKDKISSLKLSSLSLKVLEPSEETVSKVREVAEETGDMETDVKVLALAREKGYTIVSDDRNIQNVAEKMGIKYLSIFSKQITKLITWRKFCKNCKKFFKKGKNCPYCGSKLLRVPKESLEISASSS